MTQWEFLGEAWLNVGYLGSSNGVRREGVEQRWYHRGLGI